MHVFVYGTLTDPERVSDVLADYAFGSGAVLEGLHLVEGTYPTLAPGGRVDGRLLRTAEIGRLDRYEGVDRGLYVRVAVPIVGDPLAASEPDTAAVYVGDPAALDAGAQWPGEGSFVSRVARYVREQGVVVHRT